MTHSTSSFSFIRTLGQALITNILVATTLGWGLSKTPLWLWLLSNGFLQFQILGLFALFSLVTGLLLWFLGPLWISFSLSAWRAQKEESQRVGLLFNQLEGLSRKVGLRPPRVEIYHSPEINCMAVGPFARFTRIYVSTGLLEKLSPDETEAALAHCVASVSSGQSSKLGLLQGLIYGPVLTSGGLLVLLINKIFKTQNGRGALSGFGENFILGLAALLVGWMALPVVAWISRQSLLSSDHRVAQLLGTEKITNLLKRLKEDLSNIEGYHPELNPMKLSTQPSRLMEFLSTHPRLKVRIQRLESLK